MPERSKPPGRGADMHSAPRKEIRRTTSGRTLPRSYTVEREFWTIADASIRQCCSG